jgi:asparagine synthase (glutamine-hydrolysing)
MCGIAAIYSQQGHDSAQAGTRIQSMTDEMKHRGPDGNGHYIDSHVALGQRRLSIIDLSEAGAQPMTSSNGRFVIVFNGEIYNYQDLNQQLAKRGYQPHSRSDTETILNLYDAYGAKCLEHLQGMFAFVIWDKQDKTFFAARDRFGIKPLYFAKTSEGYVFASELKGILKSGLVAKELNYSALDSLFELGSVRQPETLIQGIQNLRPGWWFRISEKGFETKQYWDIAFSSDTANAEISYDAAKTKLRDLFFESIRLHLISDVPVGVFLSGGIDSSLMVAVMRQMGQHTKTFSVGFDVGGSAYNETHHAKRVAEMYGTTHTEIILSEKDIFDDLDKIVFGIDQPSADGLNSYAVSKAAAPHVKVALSGLGSDELFGGYTLFKFAQELAAFGGITRLMPKVAGRAALGLDKHLPQQMHQSWRWRAMIGVAGGYQDTAELYTIRNISRTKERRGFFTKDISRKFHSKSVADYRSLLKEHFKTSDPINEISLLELKEYMLNMLLRDADAMSMINSIEVRVPFLDHKLAEFVAGLPASFKIDARTKGIGKKILVDAFSDLLPTEIVYRKKMGFVFPLGIWMRRPMLSSVIADALSEKSVRERGLFDYKEIRKLLEIFRRSKVVDTRSYRTYQKVWLATLLELWLRKFF